MLDASRRKEILGRGKLDKVWEGEPKLGSAYGEEEIEAAVSVMRVAQRDVTIGFGDSSPIEEFEESFARYIGTEHAIALNSAGPGLDLSMRFLRLEAGDEVILPAINFVAAPLAVVGAGGRIVWGEVDPKTLQLDPHDVERRITSRTRAIFPVHFNGLSAPVDEYLELARKRAHPKHGPLAVITDAARAVGGGYKGTKIGKKGLMTVFSFHTMKNMVTLGEGGMVTTDDEEAASFVRSSRFYGSATDIWGSSYVMTKVQAAVGTVQLRKLERFIEARRALALARNEMLADVPGLQLPHEPEDCRHSYYLYTCLLPREWAGQKRDQFIENMAETYGIKCIVANPPCYQARGYLRDHTPGQDLPLSNEIGARLVCIPLHPSMTERDNEYIAAATIESMETLR